MGPIWRAESADGVRTLPDALICEDVEVRKGHVLCAEEFDGLAREAAARGVGRALHEEDDGVLVHEPAQAGVELLGRLIGALLVYCWGGRE